jgi:hypothetical protein
VRYILIVGIVSPALGQGRFTWERATALAQAKDWNGVLNYCQAWAKAEPNNPDAWFGIGYANGSKLLEGLGIGGGGAVRKVRARTNHPRSCVARPPIRSGV